MRLLEDTILKEGTPLSDSVLKVDTFINHQVDPSIMKEIGKAFADYYREKHIDKVVTIETSGIAPALFTAEELAVPLVILKKQTSKILGDDVVQTNITSFTKGTSYELTLSRKFISPGDNVVIIDDFLANGEAASGASKLIEACGGHVEGIGILIEKSFQKGRNRLVEAGYKVTSLARISHLAKGVIEYCEADL